MAKNDILLPMFTKWNLKDYHAGLGITMLEKLKEWKL
jgi:hypothetical protein